MNEKYNQKLTSAADNSSVPSSTFTTSGFDSNSLPTKKKDKS